MSRAKPSIVAQYRMGAERPLLPLRKS